MNKAKWYNEEEWGETKEYLEWCTGLKHEPIPEDPGFFRPIEEDRE